MDDNAPLIAPFPRISRVPLWIAYEVLRLFVDSSIASAFRIAVLSGAYFGVIDVVVDGLSPRALLSFTTAFVLTVPVFFGASKLQEFLLPGSAERVDAWRHMLLHRMGDGSNSSGIEGSIDPVGGPAGPAPRSRLVVALRVAAIPMAVALVMIPSSWRLPLALTFAVPALVVVRRVSRS
jgi:hypothetical protein